MVVSRIGDRKEPELQFNEHRDLEDEKMGGGHIAVWMDIMFWTVSILKWLKFPISCIFYHNFLIKKKKKLLAGRSGSRL